MPLRAHTRHARENLRQAVLSLVQPGELTLADEAAKFTRLDKEVKQICNNCDTRTLNNLVRLFEAVSDLKQNDEPRSLAG